MATAFIKLSGYILISNLLVFALYNTAQAPMGSAVFPGLFALKPSVQSECEVIEWTDEQATVTPNRSALYDPPFQG